MVSLKVNKTKGNVKITHLTFFFQFDGKMYLHKPGTNKICDIFYNNK